MANFTAGGNISIISNGNQTIAEYTININQELKSALQEDMNAAGYPEETQNEILEQSQELVEAVKSNEPTKFKRIIQTIIEKGPEVADIVLAKCLEVAIKTAIGLL